MPRSENVTKKQLSNLKSFAERPKEEARAIQRMGAAASQRKQRERKLFRQTVAEILANPAMLNGKQLINPATGDPLENMQAAIIIATLKAALKGDHKAAAKIVDWLGESNTPAGVTINVQLGK